MGLLKNLENKYIVEYKECFMDLGDLVIVMEYCEGGDIGKQLKIQ